KKRTILGIPFNRSYNCILANPDNTDIIGLINCKIFYVKELKYKKKRVDINFAETGLAFIWPAY
ncbi:MAG: hypothetical protein JW745_08175, partial [Sedimentisphaerales bacterium]|nr:hypothetical protein [Sedimentisphaerales bacterium]